MYALGSNADNSPLAIIENNKTRREGCGQLFVDQSNSLQHYTTLLHNATLNEAKMRTMAKTDNTTRYSIWPRRSTQLLPFRFFKTYSSSTSRGQGNFWPSSRVHWIASLFFIFNSNVVNVVGQLIGVHRHLQIQIKFNKII